MFFKVFVVPETATLLLSSGISFYELDQHSKLKIKIF